MKKEYDFSKARPNPYVKKLKQQIKVKSFPKVHKIIQFIFLFLISSIFLSSSPARALTFGDFEPTGSAFILYNAGEQKVLAESNADDALPIASLTKLMVATVILEDSSLTLSTPIAITSEMLYDLAEWSAVGLQIGDVATVEELLYALLLPSAGDAGQALAIADAGSIEAFADKMNTKAAELGMANSHFTNPIGRDEDNYSTARDLATLLFHSLQNPDFETIFSSTSYYFAPLSKTINKTTSTYGLDVSIITGSKTGFTYDAGRCLASTATLNGVDYLYVTLGHDPATATHITDTLAMYNYFNDNFSYRTILEASQPLLNIPINDSPDSSYALVSPETATYYLANAYDLSELNISLTHPDAINRYTDQSAALAHLTIIKDDETIYETDLYFTTQVIFNDHAPLIAVLAIVSLILLCLAIFLPRSKTSKHRRLVKILLFALFIAFTAGSAVYVYHLYALPEPATITSQISL